MNYHPKQVFGDYKSQKSMQLQLNVEKTPTYSEILSDLWKVRSYKNPLLQRFFAQQARDYY